MSDPTPRPNRRPVLTHVTYRAMATEFVVYLPSHEPKTSIDVAIEALDQLEGLESKWSSYQSDSEVCEVNRRAGGPPVRISYSTLEILQRAQLWHRRTEGAFDITAGPLIRAWGFFDRKGEKPEPQAIEHARQLVDMDGMTVETDPPRIQLAKPGMELNLGSIGKGAALDRIATVLNEGGVENYLIHGGASSVIAKGSQDLPEEGWEGGQEGGQEGDQDQDQDQDQEEDQEGDQVEVEVEGKDQDREGKASGGWVVGVAHPHRPKQRLGEFRLIDSALATSGSGRQFFHFRGKRFGHVIDPRTGMPAGDLESITVLADNAMDADAAATGLFVAGHEQILSWDAQSVEWLPQVLMLRRPSAAETIEMESAGGFELSKVRKSN